MTSFTAMSMYEYSSLVIPPGKNPERSIGVVESFVGQY